MSVKLTLLMDEDLIVSAKAYAKKHQTSLSQLVARYLQSISSKRKTKTAIAPQIQELTGVLPKSIDTKALIADYRSHLQNKHR